MFSFYSDGSSDNVREKNAGWSSVLWPIVEWQKPIIWYGHLEPVSTNNHGELLGIMGCAGMLKTLGGKYPYSAVDLTSDSEYAIGCLRLDSAWDPIKNRDLIDLGRLLLNNLEVSINFHWVKGHKGNPGNELADKFAGYGRKKMVVNDPRYKSVYFGSKQEIVDRLTSLATKGK